MNIQDLLDHLSEVKDTLSNGLVGQRAGAYAANFNQNLQTNFPALKSNPTIDDVVNTGLNIGGVGAIRMPKDIGLNLFGKQTHNRVYDNEHFDRFNKSHSKTYATENDRLVRLADSANPDVALVTKMAELYGSEKPDNAAFSALIKRLGISRSSAKELGLNFNTSKGLYDIVQGLADTPDRPTIAKILNNSQSAADMVRQHFGGKITASTPLGKYIENVNDIAAADRLYSPRSKYLIKDSDINAGGQGYADRLATEKLNQDSKIADMLSSDYYKQNKPNVFLTPDLADNYRSSHINDVVNITPRMTLEDSIQHQIAADARARELADAAKAAERNSVDLSNYGHVGNLRDGHSIVKLTADDALKAEGTYQGHCVGTYCDKVKSGKSEIYSIRSQDNKPLYTIEWDPKANVIVQAKGRYNGPILKEHKDMVDIVKSAAAVYRRSPDYFKQQGINSFEDLLKNMDLN